MICPHCKKEIKFLKILEPKFDYYTSNNEERFDFTMGEDLYCCPNCLTIICNNIKDARKYLRSE